MKKFVLAVTFLLAFQTQAAASNKDGTIVAFMEYDCWVDLGPKSIFFSDGTGYVFKPVRINEMGGTRLHPLRAKISQKQVKELVDLFENNHFNDIPKELVRNVTDSNELYVYFSTPDTYHKVKDYAVPNESLNKIRQYIVNLNAAVIPNATEVSLLEMLDDLRERLDKLPVDSPQYKGLKDFLNKLTRGLVGSQSINYAQVKDLYLKDVSW
jgi:hypothetical protein